jgi:signal transduction histidine kinase
MHEIVTALGGPVRVESEPGAGATFTMELPCSGPPEPEHMEAKTRTVAGDG